MTIIYKPDSLSLSYNIRDFKIASSESVSFVLKKGVEELISQTYEPGQDGFVTINIRDIVHAQLSFVLQDIGTVYEQPSIVGDFTAIINGTEISFRVIRSGVDRLADSATNFLTGNFLTWQPSVKSVTYYSPEFLTYYSAIESVVKLRAYFTGESGDVTEQVDIDIASLSAGRAYTIPLQYAVITGLLGNKLPAYYDVWISNASGERLTYVQRYYASDMHSEQEQWILFENSLGGIDTFRAYGSTNFTAEHTHNIAEIDETASEYRVDTERKFQKNTGHLDKYERKWLLDFFPSKAKYIYAGNYLRSIVVIESNSNYTDRELPSNYSFTYKYADALPLLNLARTDIPADTLNIYVPDVGSFIVPPRLAEFPHLPLTEGALFPIQSPYSEEWGTTTINALAAAIANVLAFQAGSGGNVGHTHSNFDLLQQLSYLNDYLLLNGNKIKAGYADEIGDIINNTVNFLNGLTVNGDKATIDADGTATVQQLIALVKAKVVDLEVTNGATAKTVTVSDKVTTLNLLVKDLAEVYDLDVSNVATLFRTIIKDYVSSETFIAGLTGEGFKLYKALSGDWNLELDNLTIRKAMTIFELIISKIRAVNGGLVVSRANGRIKSVNEDTTNYVLGIEGNMTFEADDFVRCQVFGTIGAKYYWVRVVSISGDSITIPKSEFPEGTVPAVGDDLVQMGNKTNPARQGILYLTASEDGKPRFSVLDGVNSTDLTGKNKLILGCLDGITDSDFPSDAQPSGYGLWAVNVFLKGLFILRNGKSVEDELSDQITAVRTAFEIREGQISSKVTEATVAATNAGNSVILAQGYASTATTKAGEAAGSAADAANILTAVTQKETSINQTAQAIELKAVRVENAAGRAENAEASINLKADGIVLQASNQAAQTAVNGVQIGGRNLLVGSSNGSGWSNASPNGSEFHCTASSTGETAYIYSSSFELKPNQNYVLSFESKEDEKINSRDLFILSDFYYNNGAILAWDFTKGTNWHKTVIPFATNASFNGVTDLRLRIDHNGSSDGTSATIYIRNIKLEEGTKATDWTPAPEDVAQDATNKANAVKTYTEQYFASLTVMNNAISGLVSKTVTDGLESRLTSAEAKITPDQINFTVKSQTQSLIANSTEPFINTSLNLVNLDPGTYYPVSVYVDPTSISYITVTRGLFGRENTASWSTHPSGFALNVKWSTNGSGWGAIAIHRTFYDADCRFVNAWPIGNIGQNDMASVEIFYLRGGSSYSVVTQGRGIGTPQLNPSGYTWSSGSYNSSYPTVTSLDSAPSVTYKTIAEIQAGISIVAGGISIFGNELSFAGKVTFSSLASDAQNKITTAQSTADSANSTAGSALSSANAANADLSTLKSNLGSLAYQSMVSLAKLDTTIVEGGYIKTSLIDAASVVTGHLIANIINTTDITTGRLTVTTGAKIGGWSVDGNALSINSAAGAKILVEPSGTRFLRINDSSDALMAIRADGVTGISIYTQDTTGKCLRMIAQTGGTAIESYGGCSFTARNGEIIDIIGSARVGGFALNAKTYTQTIAKYLANDECHITYTGSGTCAFYLPSSPPTGKVFFISKRNSGNINVYGNGRNIYAGGSATSQYNITAGGELNIFIFDGFEWICNWGSHY